MHPVSSLETFIWLALYYVSIALFIIVPILTVYWAWQAYRRSRKIGYIFLLLVALVPFWIFGMNKISHYIHREEIEGINREMAERTNAQRSSDIVVVHERNIQFRFDSLLLAAGVFFLYRAEKKGSKQQP